MRQEKGDSVVKLIRTFGRVVQRSLQVATTISLIGLGTLLAVNAYVVWSTQGQMLTAKEVSQATWVNQKTPILVLGAGVIDNQKPSEILALRLEAAQRLYRYLPDNPYVMSGDHRQDNYNEVQVMKDFLNQRGLPSQRIYLDHAGYSTYESLYRLKHVLKQDKVIIVTQGYHLARALMIANGLGIEAVGLPAEETQAARPNREFRELFARANDFVAVYLGFQEKRPETKFAFNLNVDGNRTNDKQNLINP